MVENISLREEQDNTGSDPNGTYDYEYFRTKFGISTEEVITSIKEAKTGNPVELEEYIADKYNLPEDNPDRNSI